MIVTLILLIASASAGFFGSLFAIEELNIWYFAGLTSLLVGLVVFTVGQMAWGSSTRSKLMVSLFLSGWIFAIVSPAVPYLEGLGGWW